MSDDLTKPAPDEPEAPTTLPADLDTPATPTPLPAPPQARGLTPFGWPYVQPDDHPLQYPAISQALAEKLDAAAIVHAGEGAYAVDGSGSGVIPLPNPGNLSGHRTTAVAQVTRGFQDWALSQGYGLLVVHVGVSANQLQIEFTVRAVSGPPIANLSVGLTWQAVRVPLVAATRPAGA
jgi:hypothetical protein